MWQDFIFTAGSLLSVAFLTPTIRDATARVPIATSLPSMIIGGVYSMTFFTLGMHFSAIGAASTCTMWSLIAALRSPRSPFYGASYTNSRAEQVRLFLGDCRRWTRDVLRRSEIDAEQYVTDDYDALPDRPSRNDVATAAAGD